MPSALDMLDGGASDRTVINRTAAEFQQQKTPFQRIQMLDWRTTKGVVAPLSCG